MLSSLLKTNRGSSLPAILTLVSLINFVAFFAKNISKEEGQKKMSQLVKSRFIEQEVFQNLRSALGHTETCSSVIFDNTSLDKNNADKVKLFNTGLELDKLTFDKKDEIKDILKKNFSYGGWWVPGIKIWSEDGPALVGETKDFTLKIKIELKLREMSKVIGDKKSELFLDLKANMTNNLGKYEFNSCLLSQDLQASCEDIGGEYDVNGGPIKCYFKKLYVGNNPSSQETMTEGLRVDGDLEIKGDIIFTNPSATNFISHNSSGIKACFKDPSAAPGSCNPNPGLSPEGDGTFTSDGPELKINGMPNLTYEPIPNNTATLGGRSQELNQCPLGKFPGAWRLKIDSYCVTDKFTHYYIGMNPNIATNPSANQYMVWGGLHNVNNCQPSIQNRVRARIICYDN